MNHTSLIFALTALFLCSSCGNYKFGTRIKNTDLHEVSFESKEIINNSSRINQVEQELFVKNDEPKIIETNVKKELNTRSIKEVSTKPHSNSEKGLKDRTHKSYRINFSIRDKKTALKIFKKAPPDPTVKETDNLFYLSIITIIASLICTFSFHLLWTKTRRNRDKLAAVSLFFALIIEAIALVLSGIAIHKIKSVEKAERTKGQKTQLVLHILHLIFGILILLIGVLGLMLFISANL